MCSIGCRRGRRLDGPREASIRPVSSRLGNGFRVARARRWQHDGSSSRGSRKIAGWAVTRVSPECHRREPGRVHARSRRVPHRRARQRVSDSPEAGSRLGDAALRRGRAWAGSRGWFPGRQDRSFPHSYFPKHGRFTAARTTIAHRSVALAQHRREGCGTGPACGSEFRRECASFTGDQNIAL